MTKLQSLADRPANKEDIGKTVYSVICETSSINEMNIYEVTITQEMIDNPDYMETNYWLFWNKPVIISKPELASMRNLLGRAKEMAELINSLDGVVNVHARENAEQWLTDLSEVCGE